MPEFNGHNFGNLPPGCFEEDPDAPWNEEDAVVKEAELLDAIYAGLEHLRYNPDYGDMSVLVGKWRIRVEER